MEVRISSPVFSGETTRTEIWRDNEDGRSRVCFQSYVVERHKIVLSNGIADIDA